MSDPIDQETHTRSSPLEQPSASAAAEQELQLLGETVRGLEANVHRLESQLAELSSELYARPYLADPSALSSDEEPWTFESPVDCDPELVYRRFEDVFRGEEEFIRERQRVYLGIIGERAPVIDFGCGRGEMLDLLRDSGVEAQGVDSDPGMVRRCREKGHDVVEADGLDYLESRRPRSLGAIFCSQVAEHLSYRRLLETMWVSAERLLPGGEPSIPMPSPPSRRSGSTRRTGCRFSPKCS